MARNQTAYDQVVRGRSLADENLANFERLVALYENEDAEKQEEFWVEYGAMEDGNIVKDSLFEYMMNAVTDEWGLEDKDISQ